MPTVIGRGYEKVWRRAGGRPWTHIIRDSWKVNPVPWIYTMVSLGVLMGHIFWGHECRCFKAHKDESKDI